MSHHERKYYEMLIRVRDFGRENAVDFPVSSVGERAFAEIAQTVIELEEIGLENISLASGNTALQYYDKKVQARENLRETMKALSRAARALAYETGGLEHKFRMPRGDNDQKLFAAARVFASDAPAFRDNFLEYGFPEDFIERFNEEIIDFNQAVNAANTLTDTDSGAISVSAPIIKYALTVLRKLDVIVRNRYSRRADKLAAWLIASHIEQ